MARLIQPTFNRGEISPELYGRVDTTAYVGGLATARNVHVHSYGGVSRRPGTRFIGPVKDHGYSPRLIEFQFKVSDTYILEFGDEYIRFIRDDGHVLTGEKNITGATNANPIVVTAASHGFSSGDEVFIEGVGGMIQLNQNRYIVSVLNANTFRLLKQLDGSTFVDGSDYGVYTSGGTVSKIYEVESPYAIEDVWELDYAQSADTMTLVHPDYDIRELTRSDHDDWTLSRVAFNGTVADPTVSATQNGTTGAVTYKYKVTAVSVDGLEESYSGFTSVGQATITAITNADPGVVTAAAHGFSDGDEVELRDIAGMTEIDRRRFIVTSSSANEFTLADHAGFGIDTTDYGTFTATGSPRAVHTRAIVTDGNATLSATNNITLTWTSGGGAGHSFRIGRYRVYKEDNGLYGIIGETETTTFVDDGLTPDFDINPPIYFDPFTQSEDFPSAVGFYQQRRVFGGSNGTPDTSHYSGVGSFDYFHRPQPLTAASPIEATLNSEQVNQIRHYVSLNDLVIFTSGSEWRVNSGSDNAFGPDTIRQFPQSNYGCSSYQPIVIGNTILFVTEDLGNVRSFNYNLEIDGYRGNNLNILSRHLLDGYAIADWAYHRVPDPRIYIVRSDGVALTLSYDQEQELIAWTRMDTLGDFEAVQVLRGGGSFSEDSVYWVMKRRVNGETVRYIEVMRDTFFDDPSECFFVDCGLSYDSPITVTNIEVDGSGVVTVTAPSHGLANDDIVVFHDIKWETSINTTTGETTVPDHLNHERHVVANAAANTFTLDDVDGSDFAAYLEGGKVYEAISTVTGLEHLEGQEVICLCDGNVIKGKTVEDASITFDRAFSVIHIGLPNIAEIETLNIESGQGTIQGMDKKVSNVTVRLFKTRGLLVGPDKDHLIEMKQRDEEDLGEHTNLFTGDKRIYLKPSWNSNGKIFIRQRHPLPLTILAIVPEFEIQDP